MEMDPDDLWKGFISVVKGAVQGTSAPIPTFMSIWRCAMKVFVPFLIPKVFCILVTLESKDKHFYLPLLH